MHETRGRRFETGCLCIVADTSLDRLKLMREVTAHHQAKQARPVRFRQWSRTHQHWDPALVVKPEFPLGAPASILRSGFVSANSGRLSVRPGSLRVVRVG
jgi:hypothetical protein